MEATEHLPSPALFRKWAAISTVAGALERKVWVRTTLGDLYPHLYMILVGPPGVGKSKILSQVENFWRALGAGGATGPHVAPKSLSKASLVDALNDAKRTKASIGSNSIYLDFNSLLVNAGELSVFIPQYDADFMAMLTDIYDGLMYEERRRGKELHITIKRPQINFIAGTTPSYLNSMLPEGAWDQGFMSRTLLIFSGETMLVDIFTDADEELPEDERFVKLRNDLRQINDLIGQIRIAPEAKEALRQWHLGGGKPLPDHPKLTHYLTRRTAHLVKLCAVASASRSDDLIIEVEDFQAALGWLLEAESAMPDVFRALGAKGDSQVIEETWHFLYSVYMARKQPIPEHRLTSFLAERVPAYNVMKIIDIMERSKRIEKTIDAKGVYGWMPMGKSL